MRAVTFREYGPPAVLRMEEVEPPVPADDEVLVRVHACSVNPGDWDILHGSPLILRPTTGIRRPKYHVLGLAIAGRVEGLGAGVTRFEVGDEVCAGIGRGGFADYACARESSTAAKPVNVTFDRAAAVPVAGTTALQALRDVAAVEAGQKVLVNGASGGVGTFAVQIAAAFGAEVTGVCSGRNVEMVRSLGAAHVVDHTQADFTAGTVKYDLILDNVGNRTLGDLRRALNRGGMLIPNSNKGGGRVLGGFLSRAVQALVTSPFVSQKLRPFAATEKADDLAALAGMIESGNVNPVVDRTYPLHETAAALAYYGEGHTRGKVVVTTEEE